MGRTTFYRAHLADCGLRYVKADVLAEQLDLDPTSRDLPFVLIFGNGDLARPYRHIATFELGSVARTCERVPEWLRGLMP